MDIDKLSLRPSEIDKNTGRIVLPKSQEELDRLSGRVPGMSPNTRVKAYMPAAQRPSFPQPGAVSQSLQAAPATADHPAFWQHPFYGILGFCALVAALPVGFFCATLLRENDQLKTELGTVETQNAILAAQQNSGSASGQGYSLTALNQEMAQIRSDVAQLSGSGIEVYLEEEIEPVIEDQDYTEPASEEVEETPPQAAVDFENGVKLISSSVTDNGQLTEH